MKKQLLMYGFGI